MSIYKLSLRVAPKAGHSYNACMIVSADSEMRARAVASLCAENEGKSAWLDDKISSCTNLSKVKGEYVVSISYVEY